MNELTRETAPNPELTPGECIRFFSEFYNIFDRIESGMDLQLKSRASGLLQRMHKIEAKISIPNPKPENLQEAQLLVREAKNLELSNTGKQQ